MAAPNNGNLFEQSPVYRMACDQLRTVAARMPEYDIGIMERLMVPKRSLVVSMPVRMRDDSTKVFIGYRVQHSLTSGASKGGLRYAPSVDIGEVAALAATRGLFSGVASTGWLRHTGHRKAAKK